MQGTRANNHYNYFSCPNVIKEMIPSQETILESITMGVTAYALHSLPLALVSRIFFRKMGGPIIFLFHIYLDSATLGGFTT